MNCGGRNHIALEVEKQIAQWMAEALGYPSGASGVFVTGSSMANFAALIVARTQAAGYEFRHEGLGDDRLPAARIYFGGGPQLHREGNGARGAGLHQFAHHRCRSIRTHGRCKAGGRSLKTAPEGSAFPDCSHCGHRKHGAIDPLDRIAQVASRERLWFHVDGAFGALAAFSPQLRTLLKGIEKSDWLRSIFTNGDTCLTTLVSCWFATRCAQAGVCDARRLSATVRAGPRRRGHLALRSRSRPFPRLPRPENLDDDRDAWRGPHGDAMLANCELAQYLAQKVRQSPLFELKAPVALNIVCFGVRGTRDRGVNRELVLDMHETGVAAPSWTTIGGESVIRCAIVNHRTTRAEIDRMMDCITGLALSRCEAPAPH